jgi:hypothetical protein
MMKTFWCPEENNYMRGSIIDSTYLAAGYGCRIEEGSFHSNCNKVITYYPFARVCLLVLSEIDSYRLNQDIANTANTASIRRTRFH